MERRGQCLRAKELSSGCEVSRKHFNSGVQPHNHSATSIVELHGVSDWILVNVRSTNAIQKHCVASEKCFIRRSEEHTSELQSHSDLVCRLLLEKKNKRQLPLRNRKHAIEFPTHPR